MKSLFDVEDQAFEVFAFGVIDVDGMVSGLRQLMEDSDTAAALGCCCEDCGAEVVFADDL